MKTKKLNLRNSSFFLFVFIVSSFSYSQSWYSIEPRATEKNLRAITFCDSLNGWATGDDGAVIHTSNGGASWTVQNSAVTDTLYDIYFVNSQNGWAVGRRGSMIKTADGGQTWTKLLKRTNSDLLKVRFSTIDSGVVITRNEPPVVFKTDDGCLTWTTLATGKKGYFNDASFLSANKYWVAGTFCTVLKTDDFGVTWKSIKPSAWDTTDYFGAQSIFFMDDSTGWMCRYSDGFYATTNGGNTWVIRGQLDSTVFGQQTLFYNYVFVNKTTGYLFNNSNISSNTVLAKTINGGTSWFKDSTFPSNVVDEIRCIYFDKAGNGWGVGEFGSIYTNKKMNIAVILQKQENASANVAKIMQVTKSQVFVKTASNTDRIFVYNCAGKQMIQQNVLPNLSGNCISTVNIQQLSNGVYLMVLKSRDAIQQTLRWTKK